MCSVCGFYRLFLVVQGISIFAQERKQSLVMVDDTHAQCCPHNLSIIQGLRAVFDARLLSNSPQEGSETGENTNSHCCEDWKEKFKLQNGSPLSFSPSNTV